MSVILNKFRDHRVNGATEILILGTFSPDIPGAPEFFFGRHRNYLWHMLPKCFGEVPLKDAPLGKKLQFMENHRLDFADLISEIEFGDDEEEHQDEDLYDGHVHRWNDIIKLIDSLPKLKAVYFTRKTFNGIPNMKQQMKKIGKHCHEKGIRICKLDSPARHYSDEKQQQWIDTMILQRTCLRMN
ncbi:MAG TPA: hypothetical protein VGE15_09135 [Sphingobacteriaceae bacterium]